MERDLPTAVNVLAGTFVGVVAGSLVARWFYKKGGKQLENVAKALGEKLEEVARRLDEGLAALDKGLVVLGTLASTPAKAAIIKDGRPEAVALRESVPETATVADTAAAELNPK